MDSLTTTSPATSPAECAQLNNPLLPPKNIIIHLVDVFFDAVQPQFRLLHRPSFVGRLGSGLLLSDKHSVLLLNAMFALSARYSNDPRVELFDLSLLHGSGYNETLDQRTAGRGNGGNEEKDLPVEPVSCFKRRLQ
jgi:Fungal specific transcription factor domain